MDLYPLSYSEFLEAVGEKPLAELLKAPDWPLITIFRGNIRRTAETVLFRSCRFDLFIQKDTILLP
ncbi:MAG: hypothetical protein WDO71_28350 [Bacteroidota bacterium]